jgi:hypothetical protein
MANDHFKKQLEAILKVQIEGRDGTTGGGEVHSTGKRFVAKKAAPMMFFPPPPPPPGAGKPVGGVPIGGVPAMGGAGIPATNSTNEWTYFIALKIDSLLPLGQLLENIESVRRYNNSRLTLKVQKSLEEDLGKGVVMRTADPYDLHLPLILLKEEVAHTLDVALATLDHLPIICIL